MIMMLVFAIIAVVCGLFSLLVEDDATSFLLFVASMICVFGVVIGVRVCV